MVNHPFFFFFAFENLIQLMILFILSSLLEIKLIRVSVFSTNIVRLRQDLVKSYWSGLQAFVKAGELPQHIEFSFSYDIIPSQRFTVRNPAFSIRQVDFSVRDLLVGSNPQGALMISTKFSTYQSEI